METNEVKTLLAERDDLQRRLDAARANAQTILGELDRAKAERDELLAACKEAAEAARLAAIHQDPDGADCPWYARLRAAIAHCDHSADGGKMIEGGKDGGQ